jgi:L-threonylcarbamoyladenylate synthase
LKRSDNDPTNPALIDRAAAVIRNGGLVVFPTRCLYGLGADAFNAAAVAAVFALKARPPEKPVSILIDSMERLSEVISDLPDPARRLIDRFWPGGITLVLHAASGLPPVLTAGTGTIGIRSPAHPVAAALVAAAGRPITATSANRSGRPGCHEPGELDPEIRNGVDIVLGAGALAPWAGSTVVDFSSPRPRILREGVVPTAAIATVIQGIDFSS